MLFRWMLLLLFVVAPPNAWAADYHVAASSGSDSNPGSAAAPWATLGFALTQVACGDRILILDSETYFERVTVEHACTPDAPLRVEAVGGTPFFDGGFPEGRSVPNTDWELVDPGKHIYRTLRTFPMLQEIARGWFKGGQIWHRLISYDQREDLECDDQFASGLCLYFGYGVFYDPLDLKIYFRGKAPSEMVGHAGVTAYGDLDPRATEILLYDDRDVISVEGGSNIIFDGISVRSGGATFEFDGASSDCQVRNSPALWGGRVNVRFRDGFRGGRIAGSALIGGFPRWVATSDVKGFGRTHGGNELQGNLINTDGPSVREITVENNLMLRSWDVWNGSGQSLRLQDNIIASIEDDVLQLDTTSQRIEVTRNLCFSCANLIGPFQEGNPVSALESNRVSFNVVDLYASKLQCRRINLVPGNLDCATNSNQLHGTGGVWIYDHFMSLHGSIGSQGWSIYHNTIRIGETRTTFGLGWTRESLTWAGERTRIFNNIVVQEDNAPINREATTGPNDNVQIDGNIYYAPNVTSESIFRQYADDLALSQSFDSLAQLRASTVWSDSQAVYPPGWESQSMEADPQLDFRLCPSAAGPAGTARVALDPFQFPGTLGVNFTGALDPETCDFPPVVVPVPSSRRYGLAALLFSLAAFGSVGTTRSRSSAAAQTAGSTAPT